jgi:uncharacterized protein YecE (DUF72 family)
MARERVGIVGWNYPEWRGTVYAPGVKPPEFLREYAKMFPIVEPQTRRTILYCR